MFINLTKSRMLLGRSIPPVFFNSILNYGHNYILYINIIISVYKAAETSAIQIKREVWTNLSFQAVFRCFPACLKLNTKYNEQNKLTWT